jgi:hypothetical protein
MGERIFAEKPKHVARRMHYYWDAWQSQTPPVAV